MLDVASGSGLVAIAAARSGALGVVAADVDEIAVRSISVNAAANGVRVTPVLADLLDGDADGAGVVLCADAFYEQDLAMRILAFLRRAHAGGARVLVGDPGRAFLRTAGLRRLASFEIPVTIALEGTTVKQAAVYEMTARSYIACPQTAPTGDNYLNRHATSNARPAGPARRTAAGKSLRARAAHGGFPGRRPCRRP